MLPRHKPSSMPPSCRLSSPSSEQPIPPLILSTPHPQQISYPNMQLHHQKTHAKSHNKKATKSSRTTKKAASHKKTNNTKATPTFTTKRSFTASTNEGKSVKPIAANDVHRFDQKLVLITGGAAGIGRATAVQLAKEKANLMLIDLDPVGLAETKKLCLEANPTSKVEFVAADCSKDEQVEAYVKQTVETFGRIDGAFINHGVEGNQHLIDAYPTAEFKRVLDINLVGVMNNLRHVLKFMKDEQGFGSVVNCASVAGHRAVPNMAAYIASKHGVIGLTKSAAIDYAKFGINTNAVLPGAVVTQMMKNALLQMAPGQPLEETEVAFSQANPAKRMGTPEEVAYTVAFLLSHQASLVNGASINLDSAQSFTY